MIKSFTHRTVMCIGVFTLALAAGTYGQGVSTTPENALVAEIRALKADINQRLDASIHAQLLVARLQLQEQRINVTARELQEVQDQLRANEQARGPLEAGLRTFESTQINLPAERRSDMDMVVGPLRTQLEQLATSDETLKARQRHLTALLAEDQSRWTAFNARLEELERTFSKTSR
jgi:hypothetical protein